MSAARHRAVPACLLGCMLALGGCLEVEQHPPWQADPRSADRASGAAGSRQLSGHYDHKPDQRHHQARFHGDRLAWNATLVDRVGLQDEYRRARP